MTSTKRFAMMLTAAMALTIASSLPGGVPSAAAALGTPGEAQIIYPFPPYRTVVHDSSVRFDVTPQRAEVFVDGYYAGIVDDFDGMLQRLRVEPGQHEITLYHDGYRTVRQRVYLARDRTFKIKLQMDPLAAGEAGEARPIPAPYPAGMQAPRALPRNPREVPPNARPGNAPPAGGLPPADQTSTGRLTIQVQPADASVVLDGQPWPASPGEALVVDLPEGRHVVQVRKPGFVGYLTEVDVRRGETTTLNVSLRTQP